MIKLSHNLKSGLLFVALLATASSVWAAPIDQEQAKKAAKTFLTLRFPDTQGDGAQTKTTTGASAYSVKAVESLVEDKEVVGYAVTVEPSGYALLRADDQAPPVKFYSIDGRFDSLPPGFMHAVRRELAGELENIRIGKGRTDPAYAARWKALMDREDDGAAAKALFPKNEEVQLNTPTWNQGWPYNYYCPRAVGGPAGRAYAGCAATAMAQILRYYSRPARPAADHAYSDAWGLCWGLRSLSDAGLGAYNWAQMPKAINAASQPAQQQAVGRLIYHCGVAMDSDYEAGLTSALPEPAPAVFRNYFNYDCDDLAWKNDFTEYQWLQKIKQDIDGGRPVLYGLWDQNGGNGHSAVCDGYRAGGEIHLNLGWSGAGNMWYDMNVVYIPGASFVWVEHAAVFGIRPRLRITSNPSSLTEKVGGEAMFFGEAAGTNLTYGWRKNGAPLASESRFSGLTTPALTISGLVPSDAGVYTLAASEYFLGAAVSAGAALRVVYQPPSFVEEPVSQTCFPGAMAVFEAVAEGSPPLVWQWRKNNTLLSNTSRVSGATTRALTINNVTNSDAGVYSAIVRNPGGSKTGAGAQLRVIDVASPSCAITSPRQNSSFSNRVFNAAGTARDNVAVAAVYYQLNGGDPVIASTSNGWTNWSANPVPALGANTLSAYAVDSGGNVSSTNTLAFVCASTPMIVKINGPGVVTPNYNGQLLIPETTYRMTAQPRAGCVFAGWTGEVSTNSLSLAFVMRPGLETTANFIDVRKPILNITAPIDGKRWTNAIIAAKGSARDNLGVAGVWFRLNGGDWTAASTSNAWTNWMAYAAPIQGTNVISAYARDGAGNFSNTNTVAFRFE